MTQAEGVAALNAAQRYRAILPIYCDRVAHIYKNCDKFAIIIYTFYCSTMKESITQTRTEDAIAKANNFLEIERGADLDGGFAARQVTERVLTVEERARALLFSIPHPKHSGFYVPLSKYNANYFSEAAAVLPGYMVLIPSGLVEKGTSELYPAVVSEDGLKNQNIRLHVLKQPYRQGMSYGAAMILSAAGQSETKGVGEHGRTVSDGIEAEHFATLLAAGSDSRVQADWQADKHVNHTWRERSSNSVVTEVSRRLFGQDIPQATITITRRQIEKGKAMLLWHEGMRGQDSGQQGQPETATKSNALVVIQALGYEALQARGEENIDTVKKLIQ